ncbi:uncharacterized protein TRIVIDRAFT_220244 [Trichoderma virens Gv29-8]|uniref:Uncharacterized protein n=1 Tax=Hypocrea virens (strain Gv29-8 / FGSC 10586) TaxID=413071 RepID=G9MKQ8_HYPVG|nr:uncharacterized protein TRIVIDRAFT_220244 [Trichoderma virens Gv29-8]EHK24805.1 hypothetical protein TRIVIDRAFT_220244 [Trichoderma virens Gv29-8]UKZ55067.1 hypothetical protein TrVGV298_008884 [Trichoderma virens]
MTAIHNAPDIPPFQLFLEASEANYHTLNDGNEINRSNVTDDATDGFTIMASLEKVIHGEGTNLHSFIGFHIVLCGANYKRRFKVVTITIRFEDEAKPLQDDPEVVSIWPDTEYIWQGMTKDIQDTKSLGGTVEGGAYGAKVTLEGKWQRQETFVRNTPARISGEKTLLKRRGGSHKNAMRIRMWENPQEESGVLRELRTGILIRRNEQVRSALRRTSRLRPRPTCGINYLDADDVAGVNGGIPSAAMVRAYGEAASCVELTDVSKRVKKEDGEWRNVEQSDIRPTST